MPDDIVSIASRPELAETTGLWRWAEFLARHGATLDEVLAAERRAALAAAALPRVLVSLDGGEPAGMATLAAQDLDQRPDLGPWLAGVYAIPAFRGRGHASRLVGAIEDLARAAGTETLWLYTRTAESLYQRHGWKLVERFDRHGRLYALMRRDLTPSAKAAPKLR